MLRTRDAQQFKTCTVCKQSLPATRECFYWRDISQGKLTWKCILCYRAYFKARVLKKPKIKNPTLKKPVQTTPPGIPSPSIISSEDGTQALKSYFNNDISTAELTKKLRPIYGSQGEHRGSPLHTIVNSARREMGLPSVVSLT